MNCIALYKFIQFIVLNTFFDVSEILFYIHIIILFASLQVKILLIFSFIFLKVSARNGPITPAIADIPAKQAAALRRSVVLPHREPGSYGRPAPVWTPPPGDPGG